MPDSREWAAAYIHQARADLNAAEQIERAHLSILGMLLQMTFEKAAKGALLYSHSMKVQDARRTHRAAISLMRILRTNDALLSRLTETPAGPWRPVVTAIEGLSYLHPQLAQGPCLEYPWLQSSDASVCWPAEHLQPNLHSIFNLRRQALGRLPRIFRFAHILCDRAPTVFG